MIRNQFFFGALVLLLAAGSTGCCLNRPWACNGRGCVDAGYAGGGGCAAGGCATGSCGGADPILGDCSKCGVCNGNCPGFTPCGYLKHMLTCGSGCGQVYYGEWISDPPNCCDPCDNCGNWTGGPCCARRTPVLTGLRAMWGQRYMGGCGVGSCCDSGCAGCSGRVAAPHGEMLHDGGNGETYERAEPPRMPAAPTPAQSPRQAAPEPKASRPTGTSRASMSRPAAGSPYAYQANRRQ